MADNVAAIVSFLKGKGLSGNAIAGILGNLSVESGFDTNAYNANEGAIGLAQWEGGRRTALQQYASQHGGKETDLNMQLGYMWQELQGGNVLQQMNSASSAGSAAAIWDSQYERSAGTSRTERVSAAQNFASNGLSGTGFETTDSAGSTQLGAQAASQSTLTDAQKQAALQEGAGPLYAMAQSVPELKAILLQAVSGGWTAAEFQNKITNSQWYRTHSDAVRQSVVLQSSDPATYKQQLDAAGNKVETLMKQMGVSTLTNAQYVSLSKQVQMGTITGAELQQQIAAHFGSGTGAAGQNYKEGMASGQSAQFDSELRQIYAQYGQQVQPGQMAYRVRQLLAGTTSIDTYKTAAMVAAKAMYPGLSDSIDKGLTVQDLAQPYVQSMSQLLEVAPDSLHLNDPMIKRALQGTGAVAKGQQPSAQPIWQFEQQVKSDPRWQYTKNAHADTSALLTQLGNDWGFTA